MSRTTPRWRTRVGALLGAVTLTATLVPGGLAGADDDPTDGNDPASWTTAPAVNPDMDQKANFLRLFGLNRYNTNHATALGHVGDESGDEFPFGESNRADPLHAASWVGNDEHPCTILLAAADVASDSLTGSGLIRQHGMGTFPVLVDIHGEERSVPTSGAVIIITRSTRDGATGLNPQALRAIRDLKEASQADNPGCGDTWSAIILGGDAAVPAGVEPELEGEGFLVYRLDGFNRHDTARKASLATGTEDSGGSACSDPTTADGTTATDFYAVSVIEWRTSTTGCEVLNRTVFLFNGFAEADALMAGVYMAFWGVPGLTTAENGSLPSFTQQALQVLDVDNIIIIGGTSRIPTTTEGQAASIAGISADDVRRVSGSNRTGTSIDGARKFAGWFPTGDGDDFSGDQLCIGGSGPGDLGFADLLGAGPYCAALWGQDRADDLMLFPVNGSEPAQPEDLEPSHHMAPLFLTPFGQGLHSELGDFLAAAFDPDANWCTSNNSDGCDFNGFAFGFGGTAALSQPAIDELTTLIWGGDYTDMGDTSPDLHTGFWTNLPMGAVFGVPDPDFGAPANGPLGYSDKVCFERTHAGGAAHTGTDIRWLSVYENGTKTVFDTEYDLVFGISEDDPGATLYRRDPSISWSSDVEEEDMIPQGDVRTPGELAPACVLPHDDGFSPESEDSGYGADLVDDQISWVFGTSLSGHFTEGQMFDWADDNQLFIDGFHNGGPRGSLRDAFLQDTPESATTTGESAGDCDPAAETGDPQFPCSATTTWEWDDVQDFGTLTVQGDTHDVEELSIEITVTRGGNNDDCDADNPCPPDTFTAVFQIVTDGGFFEGTAHGEAVQMPHGFRCGGGECSEGMGWALRGQSLLDNGDLGTGWTTGNGGFAAYINDAGSQSTSDPSALDDDALAWAIDALVA